MKKKIFFLITTLFVTLFVFAGCTKATERSDPAFLDITESGQVTTNQKLSYDWGNININGGVVSHDFAMMNDGTEDLILKSAATSCMCTTAKVLLPDGDVSPTFGMHKNPTNWVYAIHPGEEFTLRVMFDPMAHGPKATGPIKRSIAFVTTSKPSDISKLDYREKRGTTTGLTVSGNVLSKEDFMALDSTKDTTKEEETNEHDDSEYTGMPDYEIPGKDVLKKVNAKQNFVLIDVRETSELEESGVIEGAIHIPLGSISIDTLSARGISKDDEIIVYCRSGNRSRQAYELMNVLGYTNVKSMRGGTTHWLEDKRPLVPFDNSQESGTPEKVDTNLSGAKISLDRDSEDFGMVGLKEIKTTTFKIKNDGTETLEIGNITTSCACTSAEIGSKSIEPGGETDLVVTFDPTVHKEPEDKFKRTVFIETNDPKTPEAEVNIWVDIKE